jgi:alpha-mannosidase
VQIIRLSSGDAGKRVEFGNIIDWNTKESNLKAVFPLTASNRMATYNWDIGTVQRPTAEPKKFEVPSHQWIDLTDMSGTFGATILTDCKNGSDKPSDNIIRLTLIRTPGVRGGYPIRPRRTSATMSSSSASRDTRFRLADPHRLIGKRSA